MIRTLLFSTLYPSSVRPSRGIEIDHPRYLLLPRISMNSAPYALARAGLKAARLLLVLYSTLQKRL